MGVQYQGEEWDAVPHGTGVCVATGYVPKANRSAFTFRCVSDPAKGEVKGHVRESAPARLSD